MNRLIYVDLIEITNKTVLLKYAHILSHKKLLKCRILSLEMIVCGAFWLNNIRMSSGNVKNHSKRMIKTIQLSSIDAFAQLAQDK